MWLRVDTRFVHHPKFEGWPPARRWAWLELMSYCADYQTDGRIPNDLSILPRSVTDSLLNHAEMAGWIDRDPDGDRWIHDWRLYNPVDPGKAARQARWRQRKGRKVDIRVDRETSTPASTPASTQPSTKRPPSRSRLTSRSNNNNTRAVSATTRETSQAPESDNDESGSLARASSPGSADLPVPLGESVAEQLERARRAAMDAELY